MSTDTRAKLLDAAAYLISATPGSSVSLRAICDRVGVRLPTLYHFFGSREGLEDAVTSFVFDRHVASNPVDADSDPVDRLRGWWDDHVQFGLDNLAFYRLMYGAAQGQRTDAGERAYEQVLALATHAAASGVLTVDPSRAADHLSATCVGTTAFLISQPVADPTLSAAIRESVLASISSATAPTPGEFALGMHTRSLLAALEMSPTPASLRPEEAALLTLWLTRLAADMHNVPEPVA